MSNEMQQYAVCILFYCNITLHVSGAVHAHHQEYIKLKLQSLVKIIYRNRYNPLKSTRWSRSYLTSSRPL